MSNSRFGFRTRRGEISDIILSNALPVPLLDDFPNASAAYSLRLLRSAYTGSAIRVRRSNDNAEQNIGFVNGVLDITSLLSFVGANNGFVTTWYDQSGNANNATQSTSANQPQIISNGRIIEINGLPTITFNLGTSRLSSLKFAAPDTNWALLTVASVNDVSGVENNVIGADGNGFNSNGLYISNTSSILNISGGVALNAGTLNSNYIPYLLYTQYKSNNEWFVETNRDNNTFTSALISGNKFTSGDQAVYWIGPYRSGGGFNSPISLRGQIFEHIVYLSDVSTNKIDIKENIIRYYDL
jgi:hypothetical protein